jgi:hypothetical protein
VEIVYNEEGKAMIDVQQPQLQPDDSWRNLPFEVDIGNIRTTKQENQVLRQLFHSYTDVFSKDKNDLGSSITLLPHLISR